MFLLLLDKIERNAAAAIPLLLSKTCTASYLESKKNDRVDLTDRAGLADRASGARWFAMVCNGFRGSHIWHTTDLLYSQSNAEFRSTWPYSETQP